MHRQGDDDRRNEASDREDDDVSLDGLMDDPERFPGPADSPLGFVQVETDREDSSDEGDFSEERREDTLTVGVDPELVMDRMREFSSDDEVLDDLAERQGLGSGDRLLDSLRQHHSKSPGISGNDVDADWARADQVGEEAVGGSVATPDQDIVEELGEALGLEYNDNEPLATEDKLAARDVRRWELDPASADDDDADDLSDRVADLTELGLLDEEDLAELDEEELEDLVDELDDNLIDDDDDLDDEIDDMDDDFLLGGLDDED